VPSTATRLAIDLSGGLIRVAQGVIGGEVRCGTGGTPAGAFEMGHVKDPGAVGAALRQLLARAEITETRALIAASDSIATFRVLRYPGATTDQEIDAAVAKELPLDPGRMATRWVELESTDGVRAIYAVAWDRSLVQKLTDAARAAGLEAIAVDLKSACITRAVAAPSCVVLDMSSNPVDVILIDSHVPQVAHSFELNVPAGDDLVPALASSLQTVLRFYKRRRDTSFGSAAPIFILGEQVLPGQAVSKLSELVGHSVEPLPCPPRVSTEVRHMTYLTCLGLMMRRAS
jgi:hypothetical protein